MGGTTAATRTPRVSEAFFACSALVHVYGSFIFIFFHPPKGELLGKAPQKVLLGGLAMAISVLYFLKPAWRPTAASAGSAAPPAALRWLLASVPLAVSPAVLFSSFTIFGLNPAILTAAALLTDLPALPKRGERGRLRFVGGATIGTLYPTLIVPLLALKVIWALGFSDPYYHNYYLAATLASLGVWLLLLDLFRPAPLVAGQD
mmetsp:Transcript_24723/g.79837  ORF Transcript_24723/g.79837 Transcript_24723/m.79837 type:complete len:204 (+) Transcript_24723:22-633(+)